MSIKFRVGMSAIMNWSDMFWIMYGGVFCTVTFVGTSAQARLSINKHASKTISGLPIFLIEEILDLFKLW